MSDPLNEVTAHEIAMELASGLGVDWSEADECSFALLRDGRPAFVVTVEPFDYGRHFREFPHFIGSNDEN